MQKFVTTGSKQLTSGKIVPVDSKFQEQNKHIFTIGNSKDEDETLSPIQKAIKQMNSTRLLNGNNPATYYKASADMSVAEIPPEQLSAKMLFDADEYKATKRSLGHSENEIALELKRLQTSNNNTSCQPISSLGRRTSRQELKLHCGKIDFSGSIQIEPDYAYPDKQAKTVSRNLYPVLNNEQISRPAEQSTFDLYTDITSADTGVSSQNKDVQENPADCQKMDLTNRSKINDSDSNSASVKLNQFHKMAERFGYDFTFHTYLCLGIFVMFIIWAAIYFPAVYILRNNQVYDLQS